MAASRVDASRRLFARYRKFFIAAGLTLGLQLLLSHYFLSINTRAEEGELMHRDISDEKQTFIKEVGNEFPLSPKKVAVMKRTLTFRKYLYSISPQSVMYVF